MVEENKTEQQEDLSPEEKLLKVIQKGGQAPVQETPEEKLADAVKKEPPKIQMKPVEKPVKAEAPQAAAPAPVVPPKKIHVQAAQGQAGKAEPPKLKLTKTGDDHDKQREARAAAFAKAMATPKPAVPVAESAEDVKKAPQAPAPSLKKTPSAVKTHGKLPPLKKEEESKNPFTVINRFIAAGILLALGLSAYQIWASVMWESGFKSEGKGSSGSGQNNTVAQLDIYPDPYVFDDLLKNFSEKNIFGTAAVVNPVDQNQQKIIVVNTSPLEESLKNLQLIGHSKIGDSDFEGIVMDKKDNKMFFLKTGDKFAFNNEELDVIEVLSDRLVVKRGNNTGVIK